MNLVQSCPNVSVLDTLADTVCVLFRVFLTYIKWCELAKKDDRFTLFGGVYLTVFTESCVLEDKPSFAELHTVDFESIANKPGKSPV